MSETPEVWTIQRLIRSTADVFSKRGMASPRLDAELLLGHTLALDRTGLYMHAHRPVDAEEREAFRALVKRRLSGEPIAYIVGTKGFWTLDLAVDARVLIPRPETEGLVELALRFTRRYAHAAWRIVDVGTGSGALALALASELPEASVLAIDVSTDALEVARENAERLGLRDRVNAVAGDLLAPLQARPASVDLIVSNPPYVALGSGALEPDVAAHEPALALYAGADGLDAIRRLIPEAARALAPGGLLLVEIGHDQGDPVRALARPHFARVRIEKDYNGHDRVLVALAHGELPWPLAPGADEAARETTPDDDDHASDIDDVEALDPALRALREAEAEGLPVIDLNEM
jgi:release factor glutamine methyltransferase